MKKLSGYIVDYMINAPCNLNCPFCYGPDPKLNKEELSLENKLDLIRHLSKHGVEKIIIAGGEPTIDKHIIDVCAECKRNGIDVSLQTNGFFLDVVLNILPYIDWIAIPLDGISKMSQLKMRTSELHYENFLKTLDAVRQYNLKNEKVSIKVGTVLSKFNFNEIDTIAELLNKSSIDVWKIYEVRQRGKGVQAYNAMRIEDDLARAKIKDIKEKYLNVNVFYSSSTEKADAYIIIDPDSDAYVVKGDQEKIHFGKLYDNEGKFSSETLKKVFLFSNSTNIVSNIDKSFPGWL